MSSRVLINNIEGNDNIYINEFLQANRVSDEVRSVTVKIKAYKKDGLTEVSGGGLSYNDESLTGWSSPCYNFDNETELLEKSVTIALPADQYTSTTQVSDEKAFFTKYKLWIETYTDSDDYIDCLNSFWADLETLDVSW